jgi:hypothetical protein
VDRNTPFGAAALDVLNRLIDQDPDGFPGLGRRDEKWVQRRAAELEARGRAYEKEHGYPPTADPPEPQTAKLRLLYRSREAMAALGCGRSKFYDLIYSGALDARRLGAHIYVTMESLKAFIDALPRAVKPTVAKADDEGRRLPQQGFSRVQEGRAGPVPARLRRQRAARRARTTHQGARFVGCLARVDPRPCGRRPHRAAVNIELPAQHEDRRSFRGVRRLAHLYRGQGQCRYSAFHERHACPPVARGCGVRVGVAGGFVPFSHPLDASVGSPERLVFEAAPILTPELEQDLEARKAVVYEGTIVDSWACVPPLNSKEKSALKKLISDERQRLVPAMASAREAWIADHIGQLTSKGMPEAEARARVERMLDMKELTGGFVLVFADTALGPVTVNEVLADPDKYIEESLADPFEGTDYGHTTAILYRRRDGSLWVFSYAHGGCRYELKAEEEATLPRGFTRTAKGIFYQERGEDGADGESTFVIGPLKFDAETSVEGCREHGMLVRWTDRHDIPQE